MVPKKQGFTATLEMLCEPRTHTVQHYEVRLGNLSCLFCQTHAWTYEDATVELTTVSSRHSLFGFSVPPLLTLISIFTFTYIYIHIMQLLFMFTVTKEK